MEKRCNSGRMFSWKIQKTQSGYPSQHLPLFGDTNQTTLLRNKLMPLPLVVYRIVSPQERGTGEVFPGVGKIPVKILTPQLQMPKNITLKVFCLLVGETVETINLGRHFTHLYFMGRLRHGIIKPLMKMMSFKL